MKKAESVFIIIYFIVLSCALIILIKETVKRSKNSQERHEKLMEIYEQDLEICKLTTDGIKSGELKVAVITGNGIKFEKEVKQKPKKKK